MECTSDALTMHYFLFFTPTSLASLENQSFDTNALVLTTSKYNTLFRYSKVQMKTMAMDRGTSHLTIDVFGYSNNVSRRDYSTIVSTTIQSQYA